MSRYVWNRPDMYKFRVRDRHNPLPHITLSTTALKSAYKNTVFLSTRTNAELRKLLSRTAGNDGPPDCFAASMAVAGLSEVCYHAKAAAFPGQMIARLHAPPFA
jgi:hypothetical protein